MLVGGLMVFRRPRYVGESWMDEALRIYKVELVIHNL